jgi:NAD(P)-dependent dehydrogenase (short-subunit alcohol dehydrogenase family)
MGLLNGKVAVVTGAGRGIGRGEALELAGEGAKVVVNDLGGTVTGEAADKRPAEEVAELIRSRGGDAVANYDDVSDWSGAASLVSQAVEFFGGLDIVVNNAGIVRDKMLFSMTEQDWDLVLGVHLKGTFAVTHHAANHWRERSKSGNQPRAAIVNTVSSAGLQGNIGQANYGSAKAGIAALTIITSLELARYGVRCNAVAPGGITRIMASTAKGMQVKEPDEYESFEAMNPGNSAPMVAWLASDEALYVTGQVFRAVGNTITLYEPWALGPRIEANTPDGQPRKWEPAEIGAQVSAYIFRTRHPGLQIGRSPQ